MPPRSASRPTRPTWMVLPLAVVLQGCPAFLGIFGPTTQERLQLDILRGMQHAISPLLNQDLGHVVNTIREATSMGIPTNYGVDLMPYFKLAPWPSVTPARGLTVLPAGGPAGTEITDLYTPDQRQWLKFSTNNLLEQPLPSPASYRIEQIRAIEGSTSSLVVQIQTQRPSAWNPNTTQPTEPASFGTYAFGKRHTSLPTQISVTWAFQRYGTSLGDMGVTLAQGDQTSDGLLSAISVSANMPRLSGNLSGKVKQGQIALSGDITLTDDHGNRQNLQVVDATVNPTSISVSAVGQEQQLQIDLDYTDGKLTGQAKSTNPDLTRILATLSTDGSGTTIKYMDKSEPWR